MTGFQKRLNICRACPVPASREDRKCEGRTPRTRATLSECPYGLFFLPVAELPARLKSLGAEYPPFDPSPADPPRDALEIQPYILDASKPLPRGWAQREDVAEVYRRAMQDYAASIPPTPPTEPAGRGIVIVAGGKYWAAGIITIKICRHIGIELPVEMWHMPGEINEAQRKYAETMGIKLCEGNARGGWELKAHALAHSGFAEAMFLDADSYPTQAVDDFWECDGFQKTGFVMFPDRPSPLNKTGVAGDRLKANVFEVLGLPFFDERSKEAGQMFIDRRRQWKTLCLADWMCQRSNYFFQILYGDKDTWWLAARMLGIPYYTMPTFWDHENPALIHYDWRDRVRFVHRAFGKFDLYQTGFTTTRQRQIRNDKLPLEDKAWEFFEQLQEDMADDIAANVLVKTCAKCGSNRHQFDGAKHWKRLHKWATTANLSTARAWIDWFIRSLECDECRIEAYRYVADNPPDLSSNIALVRWTYAWHDATSLKVGRPRFSFEQVAPQYGWDKLLYQTCPLDGTIAWFNGGADYPAGTLSISYLRGSYSPADDGSWNLAVAGFDVVTNDDSGEVTVLCPAPAVSVAAPGWTTDRDAEEANARQSATFVLPAPGPIGLRRAARGQSFNGGSFVAPVYQLFNEHSRHKLEDAVAA